MNKYGNALLDEYYGLLRGKASKIGGITQLHIDEYHTRRNMGGDPYVVHIDFDPGESRYSDYSDNNSGGGGGDDNPWCQVAVYLVGGGCCCYACENGCCMDCIPSIVDGICGACC